MTILRWLSDKALGLSEKNMTKSQVYLEISGNLAAPSWFYLVLFLAKLYAFTAERWLRLGMWLNHCIRWLSN